jgi:glycosyltransferase involved in cell wall biosynthesis
VTPDETAELVGAGDDSPSDPGALGDVALVHDYLNQRGGAEREVVELTRMFPRAPLYTSLYRPDSTWPEFRATDVHTSPLQRVPVDRGFRALFPLFPLAFRALGEIDADVVLSSSSGWAHGVRTSRRAVHVVYCYTPARWLYTSGYEHGPRARWVRAPLLAGARRWDRRATARADHYIAISAFVADRIRRVYGFDAPIVYPPVDVDRFTPSERGERLLVVSRLLPYKRVDVIVAAATSAGIGLDVVGTGPALDDLRAIAGPTVAFHGSPDDSSVTELMQACRALCIGGVEDFGMTAVEAQAAGKPVIAFAQGGALETVAEGVTGALFSGSESASVLAALERCDRVESSPHAIAERARRFSPARFRQRLVAQLADFADRRRRGS